MAISDRGLTPRGKMPGSVYAVIRAEAKVNTSKTAIGTSQYPDSTAKKSFSLNKEG